MSSEQDFKKNNRKARDQLHTEQAGYPNPYKYAGSCATTPRMGRTYRRVRSLIGNQEISRLPAHLESRQDYNGRTRW
jgi:hypothetical protein